MCGSQKNENGDGKKCPELLAVANTSADDGNNDDVDGKSTEVENNDHYGSRTVQPQEYCSTNQQRNRPPFGAAASVVSTTTTKNSKAEEEYNHNQIVGGGGDGDFNTLDYDFEIAAALQAAEEETAAAAAILTAEAEAAVGSSSMDAMVVAADCPFHLEQLQDEFMLVLMLVWPEIFATNDAVAMELGPYVFLEFMAEMFIDDLGDLCLFAREEEKEEEEGFLEACKSLCCWEVHTDTTPTTNEVNNNNNNNDDDDDKGGGGGQNHPTTKILSQADMRRSSFLVICKFIDLNGPEEFEIFVKHMMDCACSAEEIILALNKIIVDEMKKEIRLPNNNNNNTSSSTSTAVSTDGKLLLLDNIDHHSRSRPTKKARLSSESPTSVLSHQQVDDDDDAAVATADPFDDDGGGKVGSCYDLQKKANHHESDFKK